MIKKLGWLLAVSAPLIAMWGVANLPYPGSLLLAGVAIGALVGYLLYEHISHRQEVPTSVIWEQALLGVIMLILLSFAI